LLIPKELITKAKDKLGDEAAFRIAEYFDVELDEKNLKCCCFKHEETAPSMIWNPKNKSFHCFGCSANFSILDLYMEQGLTFVEAIEKLFEETGIKHRFGEKGMKVKRDYKYPKPEINTNRKNVEEYLALRKISKETLDYCNVQEDIHKNIIFNYYNSNDVLMLMKYRPARKVSKDETKIWCQKDADTIPLLFNMNRIDPTQPLLITEGCIDCLSAIEAGFKNVVSVPFGANNYSWIEENWEWLEQFDKIIIWSDNDDAGFQMKQNIIPRLGEWRCYVVEMPEEIRWEDKKYKINDINVLLYRCGKEEVLNYINNASEIPVIHVKDYADIKKVDFRKLEGVKSGIKELDKHIYKFFFGCVNIITGLSGGGKSVFIDHVCIAEPINQGYKCFIFSGELAEDQFKRWLDLVLVGRRHIKVIDKHIRDIDEKMQEKVNEWIRGKLYVYDNPLDYSADSILKKMEELVRKKGVKVFVLDNLMMIDLSCTFENIYVKEKQFVNRLVNFAKKYNVLIHLVIHPRKIEGIRRLTKLDIGGSGSSTNLAHYVMGIHRVTPKESEGIQNKKGEFVVSPNPYSCMIDLFKNRPTGVQDRDFGIHFDNASYRFWTDIESLDKQFSWDKEKYEPLPDPRDDKLPFN